MLNTVKKFIENLASPSSADSLFVTDVSSRLERLGFKLTGDGKRFLTDFQEHLKNDPMDLAGTIAVTTVAKEFSQKMNRADTMMAYLPKVIETLESFKVLKEDGSMNEEIWETHTSALSVFVNLGPETDQFITEVLNDPVMGSKVLAKRI